MIRYAAILFIMTCCYYAFTYGISLWKEDNNTLGGIGTIVAAGIGSMVPIAYMLIKM